MTKEEMRKHLDSHFHASKKILALEMEVEALSSTSGKDAEVQRLTDEISCLREKQTAVRETIRSLNDDDLESVLIMRYINYLTVEQTADALNYARRTINEKIKKAIDKLCTSMP